MYTVLRISDGHHMFPFLYDGNYIYCPDYNPTVYEKSPQYCFSVSDSPVNEPRSIIFDHTEFIACRPFRHESHNYHQAIQTTISGNYLCLQAWKNAERVGGILGGGEADPEYTSVQGAPVVSEMPITISVQVNKYGIIIPGNFAELEALFRSNYAYPTSTITIETQVAVLDEEDIYWQSDTRTKQGNYDICFALTGWPFKMNHQWKDDLRIVGIMHVTIIQPDGQVIHVNLRSNPFQITEEIFAKMLCIADNHTTITGLETMHVDKPRIINKDIIQVVEMTSQTDSKSNIVQPVFFRTRELANIIVHPEVTENICINLDAYKAQASGFYIKIEGISFQEIGRTESGVIFKVQGNMLPGKVAGGVYYILNQDAELVTTGKYTYEA